MNMTSPAPEIAVAESGALSDSLKKKLRTMKWKPEVVMRETVLIQRLREVVLTNPEG